MKSLTDAQKRAFGRDRSIPEATAARMSRTPWEDAYLNLKQILPGTGTATLRTALENQGLRIVSLEPNIWIQGQYADDSPASGTRAPARDSDSGVLLEGKSLGGWPKKKTLDWHLESTGMRAARTRVLSTPGTERAVRVALLDTGYDPSHVTRPRFFLEGLSTRFNSDGSNDDSLNGASSGSNHGTGTMAILAGNKVSFEESTPAYFGGAPTAEVFQVAIAHDVVLLAVASFGEGLSYAVERGADVVSVSMGGIPSELWADAVNAAYDNGTVIVAASGNCLAVPILGFLNTPSRTVYPAAFSRVLSVPGATASNRSYRWLPLPGGLWPWNWKNVSMRGNIGPRRDMKEAIAGYTPNILWALYEPPDRRTHRKIRYGGSGTSCATPQVAAAAALWLQANRPQIEQRYGWRTWRKAEVVFEALMEAADRSNDRPYCVAIDDKYAGRRFGRGILQADLALTNPIPARLSYRRHAKAGLRWLNLLLPTPFPRSNEGSELRNIGRQMLQLEAAQLLALSPSLQRIVADNEGAEGEVPPPREVREQFLRALLKEPNASNTLKAAVRQHLQERREISDQ